MPAVLSSKTSNTIRDHRQAVALQVICEHFGEITRDVAEALMTIEFCTLQLLVRSVMHTFVGNKRISSKQVKQALLVLWKHNCLIVECHQDIDLSEVTIDINGLETKLKMTGLLYRVNYDYVLHRLRFGQILDRIQTTFGDLGCWIAEEIIFHGRLRYETIVEQVVKRWRKESNSENSKKANETDLEENEFDDEEDPDIMNTEASKQTRQKRKQIQKIFEQLVQNRFVVVVPPLDLKCREITKYQSNTTKRMNMLFDAVATRTPGKAQSSSSSSQPSTATSAAKTTVKRPRGSTGKNGSSTATAVTSPEELLPVELRLMMAQASKSSEREEEAEWEAPATKRVKIEEGTTTSTGRGRGRGRGGAGRGRGGRGRGPVEAMEVLSASEPMDDSNGDSHQYLPHSGSNNMSNGNHMGTTENIVRGDVYWMIGFEQFLRGERHQACTDTVADQLDLLAGEIIRIILQSSMNQELGATPAKSSALSLDEIYRKIKESAGSKHHRNNPSPSTTSTTTTLLASIDLNTLKKLLDLMRLSSLGAIVRIPGSEAEPNGPLFLVNYESIISFLRRRTILQIAQGRFGVSSGRIIELLQRNKYLEQQTVSDRAILPARETRERLYRLYRDRWVNYVELSKRGDFNPSNNYYFWYLDLPRLKASLIEHLYLSLYNLRVRKDVEIAKGKDLLEFALVSEQDVKRYDQFMQKINLLEFSIQRVDRVILLMEKF